MKGKIEIFVGSSKEAAEYDRNLRSILENFNVRALSWHDDVFPPGYFNLQSLLKISTTVDAAIIIATPDDKTWYRDQMRMLPRDNILFELGLFISELGTQRTGIVHVIPSGQTEAAALPTDLGGLTTIQYHPDKPANNEKLIGKWLDNVRSAVSGCDSVFEEVAKMLRGNFTALSASWREAIAQFILFPLKISLNSALRGEIILTPGQYYHELYKEMESADNTSDIFAVATLSSLMWSEDREQEGYLEKNIQAAKKGAKIRRLFVQNKEKFKEFKNVFLRQLEAGIQIKFAPPELISKLDSLEDMVIFSKRESGLSRAYITYQDIFNQRRVRYGKLVLDEQTCLALERIFEQAWFVGTDVAELMKKTYIEAGPSRKTPPPGDTLKVYKLSKPVESCQEAAEARCVPLKNELKTLIAKTSKGLVAVHIPGDRNANLRAIKSALECDEAYLLPLEELTGMGLSRGTVSALLEPVWSLPHLVSRSVLYLEYVTTNNKTLKGYFRFDPKILLKAESIMIGDFEQE